MIWESSCRRSGSGWLCKLKLRGNIRVLILFLEAESTTHSSHHTDKSRLSAARQQEPATSHVCMSTNASLITSFPLDHPFSLQNFAIHHERHLEVCWQLWWSLPTSQGVLAALMGIGVLRDSDLRNSQTKRALFGRCAHQSKLGSAVVTIIILFKAFWLWWEGRFIYRTGDGTMFF